MYKSDKPVVTFARWGNYTIAFKGLFEKLGLKVILPPKTSSRIIADGAKIAPELFCFPMKVTLGGYLAALKEGADTILSIQNVGGSCRQKYYGLIQEKVLRDGGYKVKFVDFRATPKEIFKTLKEATGASKIEIAMAFRVFFQKLFLIEEIEKKAQKLRPRELNKGETEKIVRESLEAIDKTADLKELSKLKKDIFGKLARVKIDKKREVFKVGIIGEIYTVTDPAINFDLEAKLGLDGIEIHREMNVSYHLKKLLFPWMDWIIQRKINPYLRSTVGGHGRDAVYEMLSFIKNDFDGVIQLLPFGCFVKDTGITVEGYLQKPIQDVKVGENVLTHKGEFKKVTKTFVRPYRGKILKIDCGGKLKLELTPEHPVLSAKSFVRNHKRQVKDLDFIAAKEIKKNDFIAIPIPKTIEDKKFLNNIRFKELKDYFLVPVKEIEPYDFKGEVFNLEVADDHSYVANCLAVHNCMPEVTVRPILEKIRQENSIPFLSLSLDEQVAEAGINTRLEAFGDVVKNFHFKKKKHLSGKKELKTANT